MNITLLAKKGGVGKSTVSILLYEAFRQAGKSVSIRPGMLKARAANRWNSSTVPIGRTKQITPPSPEVLTLSRDYFRLRKPVDRRVYELARKHCGEQDEWKISLELLHKKTGASSHSREFKSMIRELVQNDHLPDYQVSLEDEMVIFRNRMTWQAPKDQSRYPMLDPEAYHDARLVAPSYDVYYLEQEWRDMWVASGMPKLDFPGKHSWVFARSDIS